MAAQQEMGIEILIFSSWFSIPNAYSSISSLDLEIRINICMNFKCKLLKAIKCSVNLQNDYSSSLSNEKKRVRLVDFWTKLILILQWWIRLQTIRFLYNYQLEIKCIDRDKHGKMFVTFIKFKSYKNLRTIVIFDNGTTRSFSREKAIPVITKTI